MVFIEKPRGYDRGLQMSINTSAEEQILSYVVEDRWLASAEFALFYWSVTFIAIFIRIQFSDYF